MAIHRVVIGESTRFPELGRAFYDNGPAALFRTFGDWLAEQTEAGRLAVTDRGHGGGAVRRHAADGLFLRATLGLAPPTEAEIDATVEAAVTTFVKAYAPA